MADYIVYTKVRSGKREYMKYVVQMRVPSRARPAVPQTMLIKTLKAESWDEAVIEAAPVIREFKDRINLVLGITPHTVSLTLSMKDADRGVLLKALRAIDPMFDEASLVITPV